MFGPVTVTARPVRKGHQLAPEIVVTDSGRAQIMHLSPAQARALADALRDAADRAEQ
jgi:membrane protein YdbS with pleckstrin-like domain